MSDLTVEPVYVYGDWQSSTTIIAQIEPTTVVFNVTKNGKVLGRAFTLNDALEIFNRDEMPELDLGPDPAETTSNEG